MRRIKMYGGGVLLVGALLLAAIPASASAKTELQFEVGGSPLTKGAEVYSYLDLNVGAGGCDWFEKSTLGENPDKKVTITGTGVNDPEGTGCTHETEHQSGDVESETWSNGKLKVIAKVEIIDPGPCAYVYTKFSPTPAEVEVPGIAYVEGKSTGKLNKETSSKVKNACAKTKELPFALAAATEGFEVLEMKLT
jgi:hypothetical protein